MATALCYNVPVAIGSDVFIEFITIVFCYNVPVAIGS